VSSSDIASKLENIEQQIDEKEAERDRLRAALPRLLAEHTGPGMAAPRERKAIDDLDRYIADLARAREALLAELAAAEAREEAERVAAAFARSENAAAQLLEAATALQTAITSVVSCAKAVQGADATFCASLARTPSDFTPRQVSIALANRIQLALYVASGGLLQVRGLFDNVVQLKQSGRADLAKITSEYTELALRGNRPRTEQRPPA
jgi:chromosome segregation ATPase